MNTLPDSIRIEYKAKAVAMRTLSKEEALIFGVLKTHGAMHIIDLSLITGVPKTKVYKVLELFEALEKCQIDGDSVTFMASTLVDAKPAFVTADAQESDVTPVRSKRESLSRPANTQEVVDYLKENLNTANYSYFNRPDTDIVASANKFFDFYASKGWRVGQSPMRDWKAACRRAFTDLQRSGERPWAVVKFQGTAMAANMDKARQQQQMQQAPAAPLPSPAQVQPVQQLPPVAPVNTDDPERRDILVRMVQEAIGPAPNQYDFCVDTSFGISNSEYLAWQEALGRYKATFRMTLDKAAIQFANVPNSELVKCKL